jgi:hypothetical protein
MSPNLRLPVTVGIGETAKNNIVDHWNTIDQVELQLTQQGIVEKQKPAFACPEVDENLLTSTNHTEYSAIYSRLLAWYNYVTPTFARVKCRVLEFENMLDRIGATIRKELKGTNKLVVKTEKLSPDEIKDAILLDPNHAMVALELQRYQQQKIQLEAFLEILDRSLKVVSRQVEIKKLEFNGANREGNTSPRQPFTHPNWQRKQT